MFAIHARGAGHDTKVFRYKSPKTGEITEFYPERGMVTLRGNCYRTGEPIDRRESRREFLLRAAALQAEVRHMVYGDEKRALQALVEMMVEVAQRAGGQGDPFNPAHVRDANRGKHPVRLSLPVSYESARVPASPSAAGLPEAPADSAAGGVIVPRY
jgi:hypothetical protein